MTRQEYTDYTERVAFYLGTLEAISTGSCPGCEECGVPADAEEYTEEPWFSWSSCEICNRPLGGDRVSWHGINPDEPRKIVHGTCCTDCAYYLEYGRLDDTTMESIEGSAAR